MSLKRLPSDDKHESLCPWHIMVETLVLSLLVADKGKITIPHITHFSLVFGTLDVEFDSSSFRKLIIHNMFLGSNLLRPAL